MKINLGFSPVICCLVAIVLLGLNTTLHATDRKNIKKVEGSVFIVTKGQQAIKLALVPLLLVTEDEINKFFTIQINKTNNIRSALAQTMKELKEKEAKVNEELKPNREKSLEFRTAVVDEMAKCKSVGISFYAACMDSQEIKEKQRVANSHDESYSLLEKQNRDVLELQKETKGLYDKSVTPPAFLSELESTIKPLSTTKTDSDGKFSIAFPNKKQVALIAKASRNVGGETEVYYWLVWIPNKKTELNVILANDNLIETNCNECISYMQKIEKHLME